MNIDVADGDADAVGRRLKLPATPLARVDRQGVTRGTSHPLAVLSESAWRSQPPLVAAATAPLWEVAAAGSLSAGRIDELQGLHLPVRVHTSPDQVARSHLGGANLIDLTSSSFAEHQTRGQLSPGPAIVWITKPNSLLDATAFWHLRALQPVRFGRMPMLLLPHRGLGDWVDFGSQVHQLLCRAVDVAADVILATWGAESAIDEAVQVLELVETDDDPRSAHRSPPPPPREAPFTFRRDIDPFAYVMHERSYGLQAHSLTQLFERTTVVEFDSPVEFEQKSSGLALVRLSGRAFDWLPRPREFAKLVHRNATWHRDALQLIMNATDRYRFDGGLPAPETVVERVLAGATASHRLSDKGRLAVGLLCTRRTPSTVSPKAGRRPANAGRWHLRARTRRRPPGRRV